MEVLREEDERNLSATSPQQPQHASTSSSNSMESRKNSSNFGVRTYITGPSPPGGGGGGGIDEDDGLLMELDPGHDGGADAQRRASYKSASTAMSRRARVVKRWRAAARNLRLRVRRLFYHNIAPMLYRILTWIRWQILLTIGCVTLCIGVVLVGIGLLYHDRQVLFPKDHEIQYLSVADWRLNRRFRALREIGAILFAAGGILALAALAISVLSKYVQRRRERQQQSGGGYAEDDYDDGTSSASTTTAERRLFQVSPSYQPIEAGNNANGAPIYSAAATASASQADRNKISIQVDAVTTNKQTSSSTRRQSEGGNKSKIGSLSKPRKSIQPHYQEELPNFPTGSVKVEQVQMSKKVVE